VQATVEPRSPRTPPRAAHASSPTRPGLRRHAIALALLLVLSSVATGLGISRGPASSVPAPRELVAANQVPGVGYLPIVPARVVDTRQGVGGGVLGAGESRRVLVAGNPLAAAVPTDAAAVLLNVTVTEPTVGGYLTVWPAGGPRPEASNLNFVAGQTAANAVFVGVGAQRSVDVFNFAGSAQLVVDVVGYVPRGSTVFNPLQPARLVDTRRGLGGPVFGPMEARRLSIAGWGGVPRGATAVALTVTAVEPTADGWFSAYPSGAGWPGSSTVNFPAGGTVANATIVGLSADGYLDVLNGSSGTTQLVIDVSGWFGAPGGTGSFVPVTPQRIADTREGFGGGAPRIGETRRLLVAGKAGVPAGAEAVILNVTADQSAGGGFLTFWPGGSGRPTASNVNFAPGPPVANLVVAGLGPDGTVAMFAGANRTNVIVDVMGYVVGPAIPTPLEANGLPNDEDWLGWLNKYRTEAGLPAVWVDPALGVGGEMHGRYLVTNGLFAHEENGSLPYATPEGAAAGLSSNLFGANCVRMSPRKVIEGWLNSTGHALWMLNPKLRAVSWTEYTNLDLGSACGQPFRVGWVSMLDVIRGRDLNATVPPVVPFPAPNQVVQYKPSRIYVTFPAAVSSASAAVSVNGAPQALTVEGRPQQGDRSSNTVVIDLAAPLPSGRVDVSVQAGGQSSSWSFTVA
jgi:Cysteine-rich secretory protein family